MLLTWSAVARFTVENAPNPVRETAGSGRLIGPRHLLCASHMMTWNAGNIVNQVMFTPSYFGWSPPFGNSGVIHWYAYRKVVGLILSIVDTEEDYEVLVLNSSTTA